MKTTPRSWSSPIPAIYRFFEHRLAIPLVGKTCKELALQLKVELEKEYYIRATVVLAVDSKNPKAGAKYTSSATASAIPDRIGYFRR